MRVPSQARAPVNLAGRIRLTPFRLGQPASFMVFRCAVIKYSQARSPRRVVLRRDGRI